MGFFSYSFSMLKRCMSIFLLFALFAVIISYGVLSAGGRYAVILRHTEAEFQKDVNPYTAKPPRPVSESTENNDINNELQMLSENENDSPKGSWLDFKESPSESEGSWMDSNKPQTPSSSNHTDHRLHSNEIFAATGIKTNISNTTSHSPNITSEPVTHKNSSLEQPEQVAPKTLQKYSRVQVVIVTSKRSGSSFVGELFNSNPYVFYVYEPLYQPMKDVLEHYLKNDQLPRIARGVWNHTLRCNFSTFYPPSSSWLKRGEGSFDSCKSIRAIAEASVLCPVIQIPDHKIGSALSSVCHERPYTVLKTIRVQDISQLRTFVQDPELNVKILHLVRDPRAVMNSRWRLKEQNKDLLLRKGPGADEVLDLCDHMRRNLAFESSPPEWLKDRYTRVRFEDIARDPKGEIKRIYGKLGMQLHDNVMSWIDENTHAGKTKHEISNNPFSRTRDTKKVIEAWRTKLPLRSIKRIEASCSKVMADLWYERVS